MDRKAVAFHQLLLNPIERTMTFQKLTAIVLAVVVSLSATATPAQDHHEFQFQKGDRVVLLGNTLIEREQLYADWEVLLTLGTVGDNVTFRNLGWSADTVWAESRGIFDPPAKGYERMIAQINDLKPTVVIFGYGGAEAFEGAARLQAFDEQFRKLINDIKPLGCRFVFLSPTLLEVSELPHHQEHNNKEWAEQYHKNVDAVCSVLKKLASDFHGQFVDLRPAFLHPAGEILTDNGLHLNDSGYQETAKIIAHNLIFNTDWSSIDLNSQEVQELKQEIRHKNELYFHRWRPQNVTYLFGFRKHEQGNNAVEIPMFDPLVVEAEHKIADMARKITGQ